MNLALGNNYDNQFTKYFLPLEDPRRTQKGNFMYPLVEVLFLSLSAVLCGFQTNDDIQQFGELKIDWLRKFYPFTEGIPSHDTIGRVFRHLNPTLFNECFIQWVSSLTELTSGQVIGIDGKTIKGSANAKKNAIHVVSAFASMNGLCIGQVTTAKKSNEIIAIPELLGLITIKGMIVTIDAMGCQLDIAKKIIENQGDYILQVKGNQEKTKEEIEIQFNTDLVCDSNMVEEYGHGRAETRICEIIKDIEDIPVLSKWTEIKSLIRITTQVFEPSMQKERAEVRYYISSLNTTAEKFNQFIRSHWAIENNLHWTLDVTFNEDKQQRKKNHAAENMNMLCKMALNILKLDKDNKKSMKWKKNRAICIDEYREKLMSLIHSPVKLIPERVSSLQF
ncbi:ISAs1 family transposase [Halosquirtibacter xylanolyticus]|uniref:ISAs1 family transposase n=1 Tax=Halosquirtibacter xylanolyticus TaxID=3374599 RepID=UPI00374A39D5|nr:ISAs1 family transposase [Prolixibacteraceae bacterium]